MPEGHLPVASYMAVSVISRSGEVLGGLFFGHADEAVFSERDERIVEALAAQAAVAMDNARLFEDANSNGTRRAAAMENERLFKEAQEANRLKDDFLAIVSHELRTPLNAILGWSSMLLSQSLDDANAMRAIETINRNARSKLRSSKIFWIFPELLRASCGSMFSSSNRANIEAAIDSLLHGGGIEKYSSANAARPASRTGFRRSRTVCSRSSGISCRMPLNSRRKTDACRLRLERVNSHIELIVSDNGQGIEPDFLPHVFDRFRQGDSSTARSHGGLGFGLIDCQAIGRNARRRH